MSSGISVFFIQKLRPLRRCHRRTACPPTAAMLSRNIRPCARSAAVIGDLDGKAVAADRPAQIDRVGRAGRLGRRRPAAKAASQEQPRASCRRRARRLPTTRPAPPSGPRLPSMIRSATASPACKIGKARHAQHLDMDEHILGPAEDIGKAKALALVEPFHPRRFQRQRRDVGSSSRPASSRQRKAAPCGRLDATAPRRPERRAVSAGPAP